MQPHNETYQGCEIQISAEAQLTINSKQIDVEFDPSQNSWTTRYLPYSQYDSLLALAKAVVRDTAEFVTGSE